MRTLLILILAAGSVWLLKERSDLKDKVSFFETENANLNKKLQTKPDWLKDRIQNRSEPLNAVPSTAFPYSSRPVTTNSRLIR